MQVIINGKAMEFQEKTTIEDILNKLSLGGKVMAAAVNMEIVKQDKWGKYLLKENDKLELLDFVGGG